MNIEEINKTLRSLSDNDIIKEYESVINELISEPYNKDTLNVQQYFQIEMSERFMQIIWKNDEK
jgi:hypothetical protein